MDALRRDLKGTIGGRGSAIGTANFECVDLKVAIAFNDLAKG